MVTSGCVWVWIGAYGRIGVGEHEEQVCKDTHGSNVHDFPKIHECVWIVWMGTEGHICVLGGLKRCSGVLWHRKHAGRGRLGHGGACAAEFWHSHHGEENEKKETTSTLCGGAQRGTHAPVRDCDDTLGSCHTHNTQKRSRWGMVGLCHSISTGMSRTWSGPANKTTPNWAKRKDKNKQNYRRKQAKHQGTTLPSPKCQQAKQCQRKICQNRSNKSAENTHKQDVTTRQKKRYNPTKSDQKNNKTKSQRQRMT